MAAPDVAAILRAGGHRVTGPRRAVWRALSESQGHLTADELAERVARIDATVNLASVYRSLSLFEELDLVRQSRLAGDQASRWELAHPDEHFHLVCRTCGTVDHHRGTLVQSVRDHLASGHGFDAESVELSVTGVCADCADGP
ncbi:Fur family transcriptional regulator [Euzebya sp.]|uniref:Fur family transcriptional regulator n=1 Tax=Euzebya sp. TaxID=1971409 RepID=UPI0035125285